MSLRRRSIAATGIEAFIENFDGAIDDTFTVNFFHEPLFPSQEAARKAWPAARRAVWAVTPRCRIPRAATVFDGLTFESNDVVRSGWACVTFPLDRALSALAVDRQNLAAFKAATGAKAIADYLAIFAANLEAVKRMAHEFAEAPNRYATIPPWRRELWRPYGKAVPA